MNNISKRFKIGSTVYEFASASDITLRDLLLVETESAELGRSVNMGEIVRLSELFKSLSEDEAKVHPDGGWMLGITIWMSMVKKVRDSGDSTTRVPFADAISFPLSEFAPLTDPSDRQAPSGKAKKKSPTRKASDPVVDPVPVTPAP